MNLKLIFLIISIITCGLCEAQLTHQKKVFTRADTLRGSVTKARQGWDVLRYDLEVKVDIVTRSIIGTNTITFMEEQPVQTMQVDLQYPMEIDSVITDKKQQLLFSKDGNAWMVQLIQETPANKARERIIKVYYHGTPTVAKNAPWDGGLIWENDKSNNPFIATACQGLGASVWWPCKDYQGDEPDKGMSITLHAPDTLSAVSNGRLKQILPAAPGYKAWTWEVKNPINTYAVTMNIGKYSSWKDTLQGEGGLLDIEYWALTENLDKAKKQFLQTKPMLKCFEHWFGKYPFYEDSYKLVETPFLGMEHQSAIAYGNKYMNGYLGNDIYGSGWGKKWDFIIVHESGHEWFGNNITTTDIADMWVHEGFTTYSEVLFTECEYGKNAGYEYARGLAKNTDNDKPVIGIYGVNEEGSSDMYSKGAAMIHHIRNLVNDDEKFRQMLRKLSSTYFHKNVTTKEVENFIVKETGLQLNLFFDQYLRTKNIPIVEYYYKKGSRQLASRLVNAVAGLKLPIAIDANKNKRRMLEITSNWKTVTLKKDEMKAWNTDAIESKYLVTLQQVNNRK